MSDSRPAWIVAIDGPGGVGKSTVARRLAERLSLPFLETGAMYRALGYKVVSRGVDPAREREVAALAETLDLRMERGEDGSLEILLDGEVLGDRARSEQVAQVTSQVAAYPQVRRRMVELQQRVGRETGGVIEGRDIGTKVFPQTPLKFFLEADPEERARRRYRELAGRPGADADLGAVRAEMESRDRRDAGRADSPMHKDSSYTVIDTTELTADEVVEHLLAAVLAIAPELGRA